MTCYCYVAEVKSRYAEWVCVIFPGFLFYCVFIVIESASNYSFLPQHNRVIVSLQ